MSTLQVRPISDLKLAVPTAALAAIAVAFSSRDFYCAPIGAFLLSLLVVALLHKFWDSERIYHWRHVRKAQVLTLAGLVLLLGLSCRVDERTKFRRAFGVEPQAGVRDLVVDANLFSGPADRTVLMRFVADRETIDQILSGGVFEPDDSLEASWAAKHDWDILLDNAFNNMGESGGRAWKQIAPMSSPLFRRWRRDGEGLEETRILWHSETGKAYVIHLTG